jgi:hypothetical protein
MNAKHALNSEHMANTKQPSLSAYERRLWVEVDRILYQNYLTPRTVTDFWAGDRDAIIWHLRQMKERIVRSIVVTEYVEVDDLLNRVILRRVATTRKQAKQRSPGKIVQAMLDRIYPLQKLEIIRSFQDVPKAIRGHIAALNTVRNTLAHRFPLNNVPRSRRLYKGRYDLFTRHGLERFRTEMWEVQEFFDPEITALSLQLVRSRR